MTFSRVALNDLNHLHACRELLDHPDPSDPLAKTAQGDHVVSPALQVALVRLVLLEPQDLLERRDLPALMVPL